MNMAGWMKTELGSIMFFVYTLEAVGCTRFQKEYKCKQNIIRRFEQMNPTETTVFISSEEDYPSGHSRHIDCDDFKNSKMQFNTHIVNAIIECPKGNLEVIDMLIYEKYQSGLPPGDIILDKPFFNILLISNSTSGIPPDQEWVNVRKNIYSLKVALLCAGNEEYQGNCDGDVIHVEQLDCSANYTTEPDTEKRTTPFDFQGRTLVVGVVLYTPFIIRSRKSPKDSYVYSGFCIEILNAMRKSLNFTYIIRLNRSFGVETDNGDWTGAIGQLTKKEIDMMLTGMSIIAQRAKVLDFTYPFWEEPTGILMRTEQRSSFLIAKPLRAAVWVAFFGTIISISFVAFTFETIAAAVCSPRRKKRFSFWYFLWSSVAIAIAQSLERQPATRSAAGILLSLRFIAIIILVTYSANLVSNLTLKQVDVPFETLNDLADDPDHTIFINANGAHRTLLEDAKPTSIYGRLWKKTSLLTGTTSKGVEKVLLENYTAVVMTDKTSLTVKGVRGGTCKWALLKEEFFKTNFGIGLPKDSPFTELFSAKIQQYQTAGLLKKWEKLHIQPWREICKSENIYSESTSMQMADMWPIFTILSAGIVIAMLSLFMENLIGKISCAGF